MPALIIFPLAYNRRTVPGPELGTYFRLPCGRQEANTWSCTAVSHDANWQEPKSWTWSRYHISGTQILNDVILPARLNNYPEPYILSV